MHQELACSQHSVDDHDQDAVEALSLLRGGVRTDRQSAQRTLINKLLLSTISFVQANLDPAVIRPFQTKVLPVIHDYASLVPLAEQCWLDKIVEKAERSEYVSVQQMRSDFDKIRAAAVKYNGPSGGKYRNAEIIGLASTLHQGMIHALQNIGGQLQMADGLAMAEGHAWDRIMKSLFNPEGAAENSYVWRQYQYVREALEGSPSLKQLFAQSKGSKRSASSEQALSPDNTKRQKTYQLNSTMSASGPELQTVADQGNAQHQERGCATQSLQKAEDHVKAADHFEHVVKTSFDRACRCLDLFGCKAKVAQAERAEQLAQAEAVVAKQSLDIMLQDMQEVPEDLQYQQHLQNQLHNKDMNYQVKQNETSACKSELDTVLKSLSEFRHEVMQIMVAKRLGY